MLTILHPELIPLIQEFPFGLLPLLIEDNSVPILIVKAPKETLLAAKVNQGFNIYIVPLSLAGEDTIGLVSAFFDVEDEPLAIWTPLFQGMNAEVLIKALQGERLAVYFFDDHSREFLGYMCKLECCPATRKRLVDSSSIPLLDATEFALVLSAQDQLKHWFGRRSNDGDLAAILVSFGEILVPEDQLFMDARSENHRYQGSRGFSFSQLVRETPGAFQEQDIAHLLKNVFRADQIYMNPLRVTDQEEITDILILTDSRALVIQAKDSPNTESVIRNSIIRKKSTTRKALAKALSQIRGSFRYLRSTCPSGLIVGGEAVEIDLSERELRALVVVKELFEDEFHLYSVPILELAREIAVPCIALDYAELHRWATRLDSEESFIEAFDRVYSLASRRGVLPRLRVW